MAYTPTNWVDGVTPVNATNLNKLETGVDVAHDDIAALASRVTTEEAQPDIPAVTNGLWLKGVGGVPVWTAIAEADVGGLTAALAAKQATSAKGQPNGYASLDGSTLIPDAQIPATIARDTEITSAISTHEGAADPHTTYQKEAEKAAANGYASLDSGIKVPVAQIPDLSATYQALSAKGANNGYASLDGSGDVPASQLPDLSATYQLLSLKAAANGYPSLDSGGKVPVAQLPAMGADLTYEGAHVPATSYQEGDIVVASGVAYLCVRNTTATPAWPGAPQTFGYGTSLPGSPVDGMEYTLVDSLTAPTYAWRFRYTAGISDAYKWVFVGGSALAARIATAQQTSSATYVALTTAGPVVAIPRAGIYTLAWGHTAKQTAATNTGSFHSFDIGGAAAVDADAAIAFANSQTIYATAHRQDTYTLAAVTLTSKYRSSATINLEISNRYLSAIPVRVS